MTAPLLSVQNLSQVFTSKQSRWSNAAAVPFVAVNDVSFDVATSSTLGIVGESGSGKTTLVRAILRAIDPTHGSCLYQTVKLISRS